MKWSCQKLKSCICTRVVQNAFHQQPFFPTFDLTLDKVIKRELVSDSDWEGLVRLQGVRQGGAGSPFFDENKFVFLTNAKSRFASDSLDSVFRLPCLARHTWQYPCVSEDSKAAHKVRLRALKGCCVSSKGALRETWNWDKGVAGRNGRENCSHDKGKSMIFNYLPL